MATLVLRLAGPMQSWGTRSRFMHRDSETEPTKSGVLGLVAAALGRARDADLSDLASLRMAVRVDAPGRMESDYQTALDVAKVNEASPETILSHRQYLADARFLVGLEGDVLLLGELERAIRSPRWAPFLGRKSYVPGESVWVEGGLVQEGLLEALHSIEWPTDSDGTPVPELEVVVECGGDEPGDPRNDIPISFVHHNRRYDERRVRRQVLRALPLEARGEQA